VVCFRETARYILSTSYRRHLAIHYSWSARARLSDVRSFHIPISSRDQVVVGEQQVAGTQIRTLLGNESAVLRHATGLARLAIRIGVIIPFYSL